MKAAKVEKDKSPQIVKSLKQLIKENKVKWFTAQGHLFTYVKKTSTEVDVPLLRVALEQNIKSMGKLQGSSDHQHQIFTTLVTVLKSALGKLDQENIEKVRYIMKKCCAYLS